MTSVSYVGWNANGQIKVRKRFIIGEKYTRVIFHWSEHVCPVTRIDGRPRPRRADNFPNINFLSNAISHTYIYLMRNMIIDGHFMLPSTSIHQAKFARLSRKFKRNSVIIFFLYRSSADDWPSRISSAFAPFTQKICQCYSTGDISSFVQGFEWHFQIKISMNAFPLSFDKNPINEILCCLVQKHCIVLANFSCWQSRRERGFVRFRKGFWCRAGKLDKLLRKNLLLRDLYARVLVMTVVVIVTVSLRTQVRFNR